MTQQPPYPAPPPGGIQSPTGGFPPPPGYPPAGYAVPPGYPGPGYPPPPPVSPAGQPLASFADRLLATLVDSAVLMGVALVLAVPTFIIAFVVMLPDLSEVRPDGTTTAPNFLAVLVAFLLLEAGLLLAILALSYVYYVEMMFRTGQTLGKKVMKIKVVPLDPAATLDRGSAGKRFLVQHVAGSFVPGLSYVDGLWQLWDKPYQQCLHDKFARTVVVKVPA